MKDVLLLHNEYDNSVVVVSVDNIICIDTEVINNKSSKRCSKIYLDTQKINPFCVNETPEKIYSMIIKQNK